MAKMRVMAVKYGFAIVEAETEEEAIEKAKICVMKNLIGQIQMMCRLQMMM